MLIVLVGELIVSHVCENLSFSLYSELRDSRQRGGHELMQSLTQLVFLQTSLSKMRSKESCGAPDPCSLKLSALRHMQRVAWGTKEACPLNTMNMSPPEVLGWIIKAKSIKHCPLYVSSMSCHRAGIWYVHTSWKKTDPRNVPTAFWIKTTTKSVFLKAAASHFAGWEDENEMKCGSFMSGTNTSLQVSLWCDWLRGRCWLHLWTDVNLSSQWECNYKFYSLV